MNSFEDFDEEDVSISESEWDILTQEEEEEEEAGGSGGCASKWRREAMNNYTLRSSVVNLLNELHA